MNRVGYCDTVGYIERNGLIVGSVVVGESVDDCRLLVVELSVLTAVNPDDWQLAGDI